MTVWYNWLNKVKNYYSVILYLTALRRCRGICHIYDQIFKFPDQGDSLGSFWAICWLYLWWTMYYNGIWQLSLSPWSMSYIQSCVINVSYVLYNLVQLFGEHHEGTDEAVMNNDEDGQEQRAVLETDINVLQGRMLLLYSIWMMNFFI